MLGAQAVPPRVDLGLGAPLGELRDIDAFASALTRHLTWRASSATELMALRIQAVRIDRGRVTASGQRETASPASRAVRVAAAMSQEDWRAFLSECCLSPDDPPMTVLALSGSRHLSSDELEKAIADVAERGILGEPFLFDSPMSLEWGRHVVIAIAAGADSPILVRPLLLVLRRR
jgi:hypothetical protein